MRQLIVNVEEEKVDFFMELIKNLDFVKVENRGDWYEKISDSEKESIQKGLEDIKTGKVYSHEEVMRQVNDKIESFKKPK